MKTHLLCATALSLSSVAFAAAPVQAVTVHDNGGPLAGGNASQIASAVSANDFSLADETELTGFTFFASVDDDAPDFATNFSGVIGWAIFADNGAQPGALLFSGHDAAPVVTDTGLVNLLSGQIVQIDAAFTAGLTLAAGDYWLALHEGEWGSLFDNTEIFWQRSSSLLDDPMVVDPNETNPVNWPGAFVFDGAFVLQGIVNDGNPGGGNPGGGDPGNGNPGGPGNGANIPEPATATLSLLACALIGRRRR